MIKKKENQFQIFQERMKESDLIIFIQVQDYQISSVQEIKNKFFEINPQIRLSCLKNKVGKLLISDQLRGLFQGPIMMCCLEKEKKSKPISIDNFLENMNTLKKLSNLIHWMTSENKIILLGAQSQTFFYTLPELELILKYKGNSIQVLQIFLSVLKTNLIMN